MGDTVQWEHLQNSDGIRMGSVSGRAGFTQNRALFIKKCGGPMGARMNFCKGATRGSGGRKSPSGVQGRSPGGGLGAKPPEADGILLK